MKLLKDENGAFSSTKLMNFVFFGMAVVMFIIGVIANWLGKEIQPELFLYVAGLTGGGFLQYSFKKKIDKK